MPVAKLLVANRGEIAVRVFRTCRELGIATVAVAAPDDRGALHTRVADQTVEIASYLDGHEHVRAAREAGADAVHPGYGFLAESPAFAGAVEDAGLTFVGPSPEALRLGGDKLEAKQVAEAAGVPTVPAGEPHEIGFPLVIKAAAGGGGRGMRVVRDPRELDDALEAARREAQAAFGDDRVFCERYLERPRHVEIQLAAGGGTVVALGERECSIQRRHQKVLEESPAVDAELRGRMSDAAVAFARAIGYRSLGTAEFMVAPDRGGDFFFLELNGRIQVEHPVTEVVTGLDLVALQLAIADGAAPEPAALEGHAVEVRLYAEDPLTFLPQTGRVERLRLPAGIRVDAGVAEGDEVGVAYDPMIAKLIAAGATREEALDRLAEALAETQVGGLTTNLPFLRWLAGHPAVRAGETTTAFLADYPPLSPYRQPPHGPWRGAFRLNLPAPPPHSPPDVAAAEDHGPGGESSSLTAPMPGTVIKVLTEPGAAVSPREPLVVLEAMKMETPVVSPYKAVVKTVHVSEGDLVTGGQLLVELEE